MTENLTPPQKIVFCAVCVAPTRATEPWLNLEYKTRRLPSFGGLHRNCRDLFANFQLSVRTDTHTHMAFLIVWVSVMISEQEGPLPWYTKDFIYCTPEKREVLISHSASQLPHRSRLYICYIEGVSLESEQETITPRPGNEWMCVNTKGHSLAKSVILNLFSFRKYISELLREFLGLQRCSVRLHMTHKHTEAWQVPSTFIKY